MIGAMPGARPAWMPDSMPAARVGSQNGLSHRAFET